MIVERAIPYGLVQQELSPCHLQISCARFRGKFQLLDDLLACAAGISSPESQVLQRLGHRHAFEIPTVLRVIRKLIRIQITDHIIIVEDCVVALELALRQWFDRKFLHIVLLFSFTGCGRHMTGWCRES